MILILTDNFDKHADLICSKLGLLNCEFFRFNLDVESLTKTLINFDGETWTINQKSKYINSKIINTVWVRRPFVEVLLDENTEDTSFKIWRGEWNKTLLGFYNSIKIANWLNPLAKSYRAENKYLQMEYAKKVDFIVPAIIVSNEKERLIDFSNKNSDVVMKLMNQDFYKDSDGKFKGIYVNKVSVDNLKNFGFSEENPIVLQSYIEKSFEVRYTVVGQDHHVCKIDSQLSNKANIDWRRYDIPNTPHNIIEPPTEIKEKVSELLDLFGLNFGALDFIVSPTGDWYFLEINTMGQWLWIEELTGLTISDSIVKWLNNNKRGE
jgi:hypothetical protein